MPVSRAVGKHPRYASHPPRGPPGGRL